MYDKVIWSQKYDPRVSAIYALNDIDIKAPVEVVWKLLIEAEHWLNHFPPENQVQIHSAEKELTPGALYRYHQDWLERLARAAAAAVNSQ